jgi:hypothetical protein
MAPSPAPRRHIHDLQEEQARYHHPESTRLESIADSSGATFRSRSEPLENHRCVENDPPSRDVGSPWWGPPDRSLSEEPIDCCEMARRSGAPWS